jgi:hypothetical protein
MGQLVEAHAMLSTALALFAAMGISYWATHTRTILSDGNFQAVGRQNRHDETSCVHPTA